jgi:hypothetical protein
MHLKLIHCQILTREIEHIVAGSAHAVDLEPLTMGLHDLGAGMSAHLQERIDAAEAGGYDAILLGYALCGRGTEGLRARRTQLVLPRAHDCIGLLMGGRERHLAYFENHPGVYYRSPGWVEFQSPGKLLEPGWAAANKTLGERRSREDLIAQYGEENGNYLFEQFNAYSRHYSGLTYISTGVSSDEACRNQARAEAEKKGWVFEEVQGSLALIQSLVNGPWHAADFLVVPPGAQVRVTLGEGIVEAV